MTWQLLSECDWTAQHKDGHGWLPLHHACFAGRVENATKLLAE